MNKERAKNYALAINDWKSTLSASNVVTSESKLNDYNATTYSKTGTFTCVLKPQSTTQVSQILKIANKYAISIYTISKGQNYGLGSKVSVSNDPVLLDLSEMNSIVDFSEELAYVTVQPGVTFKQLGKFLQNSESELMMDSIGSTGEASIIGNTAERGHGVALNADRFAYTCGMEVVLPTGEIINTGFAGLKHSKVNSLSKWGLGPSLDGLFTQSNYGIITKLSVWLQPKPNNFQIVMFQIDREKLTEVMECMRSVYFQRLSFSLRIFNDYRMISFSQQYPWEEMKGKTPLSDEVLAAMKNKGGITGDWVGFGALYSINDDFAKVEKAYLNELLSPLVRKVEFYDETRATKIRENGSEQEQDFIDFIYDKTSLRGFTSERALNMCYWRLKMPIPPVKDLHRDKCGVLWYCPIIPNTAADVKKAVDIIEKTSHEFKLEPNVGFLFINERALDITGAICYDKSDPNQEASARACHDEIMNLFLEEGYPPYRLGIQSMGLIADYQDSNREFFLKIKGTIDPNNILSRGRYIPDM